MELHQLRAFVAVSREGTVAGAADALSLTASPVSRTIRELERHLGSLFDRDYHRMTLTDVGRRLLPGAVRIVRESDDLVAVAAGRTPPVRYAASPWIPAEFAQQLGDAADQAGAAEELDGAMSSVLLHRMVHGDLDIAVVHLPVPMDGVATMAMARYQFTLAVAPTDPLAQRDSVSTADLAGRRVILAPVAMQPAAMRTLRAWLEAAGVDRIDEVELGDLPTLGARLRRGGTVALGTSTGLVRYPRGTVTVPFDRDNPDFQVGLVWRSDDPIRGPRLRQIVETLRPSGGQLAVIG
jgi:DNA-binding transcriptional LysR family regulator